MKSNKLAIAIVTGVLFGALGTSAFADDKPAGEGGTNWQDHIVSTKTRAQVVNDLKLSNAQAQLLQDGSLEFSYPRVVATSNGPSRADNTTNLTSGINADLYFGG